MRRFPPCSTITCRSCFENSGHIAAEPREPDAPDTSAVRSLWQFDKLRPRNLRMMGGQGRLSSLHSTATCETGTSREKAEVMRGGHVLLTAFAHLADRDRSEKHPASLQFTSRPERSDT